MPDIDGQGQPAPERESQDNERKRWSRKLPSTGGVKALYGLGQALLNSLARWVARTFQGVFFLTAVTIVSAAVTQLANRESLVEHLRASKMEAQDAFVELLQQRNPTGEDNKALEAKVEAIERKIQSFDHEMERLNRNFLVGTLDKEMLFLAISAPLLSSEPSIHSPTNLATNERPVEIGTELYPVALSQTERGSNYVLFAILDAFLSFSRYSSSALLGLVVVGSGLLGAMLIHFKSNRTLSLGSVVVGVGSGFVALLALKGGHHVFVENQLKEQIAFNPYSSALAGLVAGFFSDKLFQVMALLVEIVSRRAIAAANSEDGATALDEPGRKD